MKQLGWTALVVLVAAGALWLARDARRAPPAIAHERAPGASESPSALASASRRGTRLAEAPALGTRTPGAGPGPAADEPEPWPRGAGLRGRLVEEDGTPVPDTPIELLEAPSSLFVVDPPAAVQDPRAGPGLTLAATRTDAEGRFRFEGARERAVHALGIDLGGRRAALRVVEEGLRERETIDVGEVVVAAAGELRGRVLDAAGNPLRGVRVRACAPSALTVRAREFDLHRLRSTSLLVAAARRGERAPVVLDLAPWVLHLADRFPVPTAETDGEGRFALDVPLAQTLLVVADDPRFLPCAREGVAVSSRAGLELDPLVLGAGRTLTCRVLDDSGEPVLGAEVFAGTFAPGEDLAVCAPAAPDEDGLHRRDGASDGPAVFAVRVGPGPWTVAGPFDAPGTRTLRLAPRRTLALEVRDRGGRPVEGFELLLQPGSGLGGRMETAFLARWDSATRALVRKDETTFELAGLVEGDYLAFARADGCAPLRAEIEVRGNEPRSALVFERERLVRVRVLDGAAPLAGVEVQARVGRQGRYVACGRSRTDAAGLALLPRPSVGPLEELHVRVEEDGHAVAGATVAEEAGEVELRLQPPARVAGRVHHDGRAPPARYLVALQPSEPSLRDSGNLPWHALTAPDGSFRVAGLPPGSYRYDVGERFLAGDPLPGLGRFPRYFDLDKGILEKRLAQGTLELCAGEEARLELDLGASSGASRRSAGLRGRFVRNGRGLAGLELELDVEEVELVRVSDALGAFDFGPVPAGRARLKVEDHRLDTTILRLELELGEGEQRVLELGFDPMTVDLRLLDARGAPLAAELVLRGHPKLYERFEVSARTDASGRARVTLPGCGGYSWSAEGAGPGATGRISVLSADELVLRVPPVVPLSGSLELAPELLAGQGPIFLVARPDGGSSWAETCHARIDRGTLTFAFDDILPGRYQLFVMSSEQLSVQHAIDVPEGGLAGQRLVFELQR